MTADYNDTVTARQPLAYLDNAATVYPKPREILEPMLEVFQQYGVNPGRSGYDLCIVGGDLVDYLELDGFRHGVLLGDVAGKGLGAALLSAKLQATLRALVYTNSLPRLAATKLLSAFSRRAFVGPLAQVGGLRRRLGTGAGHGHPDQVLRLFCGLFRF